MTESTKEFVNQLLSQMTLDEKIGQLSQVQLGKMDEIEMIQSKKLGSLINSSLAIPGEDGRSLAGVDLFNHFQKLALETRLKIPLIIGRDVIHGFRTIFPIPLAQAASFNPELAGKAASIAALEASASGIKWTFAPMLDIARDPRWGRVAEGNGEDPFLGARMAESLIKGYQGDDPAAEDKVIACAKHYVGYGSAEGGRDYENGEISELTLRDIYLPPFESAVRAGVGTVMSAFLDLNGTPATANHHLLTDVLRGEWGFDGFVVSDWDSVAELMNHGVAENRSDAAAVALKAGVDMDMVSRAYLETLESNLNTGKVALEEIDRAVKRILGIKVRAGLFTNPFTDLTRSSKEILTDESRRVAREIARESMVLLKNRGDLLPLNRFKKILFAGNFVNAQAELFGTWVFDGHKDDVPPLYESLTDAAPMGVQLWFTDRLEKGVDRALDSDVIVLLLGEHPRMSGENANLSDPTLPSSQVAFVDKMVSLGKAVVLVVFAGRPLVITRQFSQADAVIYAWHPGIEGGAALGEILFGKYPPSGRIPITFPRAVGQIPVYYNHKNSGRPVTPSGEFRTRYLDLPPLPLFPFGYGLSYSNCKYDNLKLDGQKLIGEISISAQITNVGGSPISELVQLYIHDLVGTVTRPIRELKGFQRVMLNPGETRQVIFKIDESMLTYTHNDGSRKADSGRFHAWISPDSASGLMAEFII